MLEGNNVSSWGCFWVTNIASSLKTPSILHLFGEKKSISSLIFRDSYSCNFQNNYCDFVRMRSSPLNRCIESLKSVLAGIYSENLRSLSNMARIRFSIVFIF